MSFSSSSSTFGACIACGKCRVSVERAESRSSLVYIFFRRVSRVGTRSKERSKEQCFCGFEGRIATALRIVCSYRGETNGEVILKEEKTDQMKPVFFFLFQGSMNNARW